MIHITKPVILASASPRRKEILALSGIDFEVLVPACREDDILCSCPPDYVEQLSLRKCMEGSRMASGSFHDALVIGADTIVCLEGQILGKPADERQAYQMLRNLSGKTHDVFTGVSIHDLGSGRTTVFHEQTQVQFYDLTDEEIRTYIETKEPMDKAGAYGIQGRGAYLVKRINGDYYNVVGLPFARLMHELKTYE